MPFDLDRFVAAQAGIWPMALAELAAGDKRGHWMWFVFPQIAGLGRSEMARLYAIASIEEARAYLAHPVLGPRLADATAALLRHTERSPTAMLGGIDAIKLRSSLTLFESAGGPPLLGEALDLFFGGERDPDTLRLLAR